MSPFDNFGRVCGYIIYDVRRAKFKGRMECLEGVFKGMERRKRGRTTHFSWEAFLKKLKLNFFL